MTASISVLLFARYAELLGAERLELAASAPLTVGAVIERLRSLPGGAQLPAAPLCAVNLRQARLADIVAPGDEVALLPPLAGG
ncbi:MAG TPA: MoaD/ThiS family protein [Gemmatimonadales bacterium]